MTAVLLTIWATFAVVVVFAGRWYRFPLRHYLSRSTPRVTQECGREIVQDDFATRLLEHHQVPHRSLPEEHRDHRQRADPGQKRLEGRKYRPLVRLGSKISRSTRGTVPGRRPEADRPLAHPPGRRAGTAHISSGASARAPPRRG
jgi:hypothetical protein